MDSKSKKTNISHMLCMRYFNNYFYDNGYISEREKSDDYFDVEEREMSKDVGNLRWFFYTFRLLI